LIENQDKKIKKKNDTFSPGKNLFDHVCVWGILSSAGSSGTVIFGKDR